MRRVRQAALVVLGLGLGLDHASGPTVPVRILHAGFLQPAELTEVSGLAPSRRQSDLLWAINDSGNAPALFAVGTDGSARGRFVVDGVVNRDWEDLASFRLGGEAYLLIADVGDNEEQTETPVLYFVREPALPSVGEPPTDGTVTAEWSLTFRYEDGPHDCEAVAVDAATGEILLVSKRTQPPLLYELPLDRSSNEEPLVARRVGQIAHLPPPTEQDLAEDADYGRYRSHPTGLDLAPDGSAAALLTYQRAYLFPRRPGESWADTFRGAPQTIELPRLRQAEAICFGPDRRTLFITTEQRPTPLLRLEL